MIEKIYVVVTESYDYFGGHRFGKEYFTNLTDAFAHYKKMVKYTRFYDDGGFYRTEKPSGYFVFKEQKQPKHGRVLGYQPVRVEQKEVEEAHFFNFDDEEIII